MTTSFTSAASTLVEHPLSPTIGAELHGVDLREELSEQTIADIRGALPRGCHGSSQVGSGFLYTAWSQWGRASGRSGRRRSSPTRSCSRA